MVIEVQLLSVRNLVTAFEAFRQYNIFRSLLDLACVPDSRKINYVFFHLWFFVWGLEYRLVEL